MSFPVDMLNRYSHEDLQTSAEQYFADLRYRNPNHHEFFSLPDRRKIPIRLSTVGFVPLYGEEQTHKLLALFAPGDLLTAVALYLANQWWSIDDILRTSIPARQGLHQVKSVGERIVLYVLNRIIYRTQEIERNEVPFLCHGSTDYAKIMWKKGEAIGFYSVKPKGKTLERLRGNLITMFQCLKGGYKEDGDSLFTRSQVKKMRGKRYNVFSYVCSACKQYLEKYTVDPKLLWEVEGAGSWFQRTNIMAMLQREKLKKPAEALQKEKSSEAEDHFSRSTAVCGASEEGTELEKQPSVGTQLKKSTTVKCYRNITAVSFWTQSSNLKRPRIRRNSQESRSEASQGVKENAVHMSESRMYLNTCCRLEIPAHTSESSEDLVEVPEENTVEKDEEMIVENEGQSVLEAELHVSPPEKQSEKEETPSEPFNGEVTDETGKTSLTAEEETANEVLSGELKLQSESQGEEPLTLFVPLILEPPAKPSEDTISEKVLNVNDSEVLTEENTSVEKEGTEEQLELDKTIPENTAASASKEEPSDNGLPHSVVNEAAEESVSENVSPKTASSLEDQNEEAGNNSQEAPVALSQSSLIVVELEGVSFQQPSGQEGQKNQLEEHSEESAEQIDKYMQTSMERAADSSSEEAEIEVPIVDRRNLRRKAKGYKGPPKKKGKPA
ncbi:F169A protein, partial [Himantopus himantopus]|nr:F169A protein [Himantopus himantopus]